MSSELVRAAQDLVNKWNSTLPISYRLMNDLEVALASAEKADDGWIEVVEGGEMPKEEEYIELCINGETVCEGYWSTAYKSLWRATRTPGLMIGTVTHWRPLHAPPKARGER